jgi:hypothetical protein
MSKKIKELREEKAASRERTIETIKKVILFISFVFWMSFQIYMNIITVVGAAYIMVESSEPETIFYGLLGFLIVLNMLFLPIYNGIKEIYAKEAKR